MREKSGFTLIELLVVIVVLGLIIVFAVPTIINSLDNSKKNIFAEQLTMFSGNIITKYADLKIQDGSLAPKCFRVLGLKEASGYDGYILVADDGKSVTLNVYNNEYVYQGNNAALVSDKGKAIPKITKDEYNEKIYEINTYINDPASHCYTFNQ